MSILVNASTKVIVQGITGTIASFHAREMARYGTNIVAGVVPGKGGSWVLDDKVPVFDAMQTAVEVTEANASVIFVSPRQATDALYEAADSGVELVVCITEGIPIHDVAKVRRYMEMKNVRLIGPNCAGLINPGEIKIGVIPNDCVIPGKVGIISRSGTLSYSVMHAMKDANIGVSTCVGIGGDIILGTTFVEALEMFETDPYTEKVLMIGEIGGTEEERATSFIPYRMTKPVVAFLAGNCAVPNKKMGHSGAFIEAGIGGLKAKREAFDDIGVPVAENILDIVRLLKNGD